MFLSMGAGTKSKPTRIQIADLSATHRDPLARAFCQRLRAVLSRSSPPMPPSDRDRDTDSDPDTASQPSTRPSYSSWTFHSMGTIFAYLTPDILFSSIILIILIGQLSFVCEYLSRTSSDATPAHFSRPFCVTYAVNLFEWNCQGHTHGGSGWEGQLSTNHILVDRLQPVEDLINRLADAQVRPRGPSPEPSLFDSGPDTSTAVRRLRGRWDRMRRETSTLIAPTPIRPRTSLDDMMAELLRPPQPPAPIQIQPPPTFNPLSFRPDARGPRPRSASPTLLTELPRPFTVPIAEPHITRDIGRRRPSRPGIATRPNSVCATLVQSFFEKFMIAEDKDREPDQTDRSIPFPTFPTVNLMLSRTRRHCVFRPQGTPVVPTSSSTATSASTFRGSSSPLAWSTCRRPAGPFIQSNSWWDIFVPPEFHFRDSGPPQPHGIYRPQVPVPLGNEVFIPPELSPPRGSSRTPTRSETPTTESSPRPAFAVAAPTSYCNHSNRGCSPTQPGPSSPF
ncbi:hypothetical protein V8E53_002847 [Lactarius tabidus]